MGLWSYFIAALPIVLRNIRVLPVPVLVGCALSICTLSISRHKELRFAVPVFAVLSAVINRPPKLMIVHLALALFFSRMQGVAPTQVMHKLRYLSENKRNYFSALFLSCHSTPWTTHVHDRPQVELDFLDCAPPQVTGRVFTETDLFNKDRHFWLKENSARVESKHAVVFDDNEEVEQALTSMGFVTVTKIWDGFFGDSDSKDFKFLGNFKFFVIMIKQ